MQHFTSSPGRPGVPCSRCGGSGIVHRGPCFLCMAPPPIRHTADEMATFAREEAHGRAMFPLRRDQREASGLTHVQRREALAVVYTFATIGAVVR